MTLSHDKLTVYSTIAAALASPLDYPPLCESVFPGDRVIVVPDRFAATQPLLVAEVVTEILKTGLEPGNIGVALPVEEEKSRAALLRKNLPTGVECFIHRSDQRADLALIAVDERGRPMAVNRRIVDADFLLLLEKSGAREGSLIPRFADHDTQLRFRKPLGKQGDTANPGEMERNSKTVVKRLRREMASVVSLLGAALVLRVFVEKNKMAFSARQAAASATQWQ